MLKLSDGRTELFQWDTGRMLTVDAAINQVHFAKNLFGRSIDEDVTDGVVRIPDILLQTPGELNVWGFVGTPENGYTKVSKILPIKPRNKPADYVFTPPEQTTLAEVIEKLNQVPADIEKALTEAKASGEFDGDPGYSPVVSVETITGGYRITITDKDDTKTVDVMNGKNGNPGRGIVSVVRTSGTGAAGTTDTYTITYSDNTTSTFNVYNGKNGEPYTLTDADKQEIAESAAEMVDVPVKSVNGKTGAVQLSASDVGARANTWMPTASDVGALPASTEIPKNTSDLTNDSGYITVAVASLLNYYLKTETYAKTETYSQTEIDNLILGLDNRLKAIADSDDTTLDQLSEIVAYIKSNKSLIDSITTNKVNVADIVNNLTTADAKKPLSAAQGKELKTLYDSLPSWAKASSKPSYSKSEVGLGNVDNVRQYSASNPPPYPVTSVNGKTGAVQLGAADVGAATSQQFTELSEAIADYEAALAGKLARNQGTVNAGKILVVGTDGNLTLTDMPEASGDVVGTLDESNNILLTGTLADGTYTLKYKLSDGTYADAGTLTVSQIVVPKYTNILTSGQYEIQLNKRWSASSKAYSASNGMIAFKIPVADAINKTIRFKGFTSNLSSGSNQPCWYLLDSSNARLSFLAGTTGGNGNVWNSSHLTSENDIYALPVNNTTFPNISTGAWIAVNLAVNESAAITTLPDTLIMTIGEEIE